MSTTAPIRIGMIGLDTSHVTAFAGLLMDREHPHHVPGATVVAAYPGGSPDFELSASRVEGFTRTLGEKYGVAMLDSPEEVAQACDLLMIESVDGRVHRELFERTIGYGRPTFIDKPFATELADGQAMLALAEKQNVALMSCSSLRYADTLVAALADDTGGALRGVETVGPLNIVATQPGYAWYGIHALEMIVAALGPGCCELQVLVGEHDELMHARWSDGRFATYHGLREMHNRFLATLHRDKQAQQVDCSATAEPPYASLLRAILASLPQGHSDVPAAQMLEVMRVMQAANESRQSGQPVRL